MRSIARSLIVHIVAGVAAAVVVAGVGVHLVARWNFLAQFDGALIDRAETLATLVVEEGDVLEFEYEGSLAEEDLGVLTLITTGEGETIARSPGWPETGAESETPLGAQAFVGNARFASGKMARLATISRAASKDQESIPPGAVRESDRIVVVRVIGDLDGVRRAETTVLAALILGGVLALVGSVLAVLVGVRRGLAPVRSLGAAVDRVDENELVFASQGTRYPDELRPIVSALEALLERSRAAMARERRFTDAAAHELRTPIAELRTITDVAARWPEPDRLRRGIGDARGVITRMGELLESLLAAARGTTGLDRGSDESVAILPLARSLAEEAVRRLDRSDVEWAFAGDESAAWRGPVGVVEAIVRNLVENAAEYTPEGGSVRVVADSTEADAALEVDNGPVTLEQGEASRLFEPFWRADGSRTDRAHRGLGLAIVASLGSTLGLRHDAAITPEGRLRVRLSPAPGVRGRGASVERIGG